MDTQAPKLRAAVRHQQALSAGTAVRYPMDLRRQVLAYARERQAAGESLRSVVHRLGVRSQILYYWREVERTGRFRRVRMADAADRRSSPADTSKPVLVTPCGLRVEGLDVAGLAALLRALS